MGAYEIQTTVSGTGEIHLTGLPFKPGTEVGVIVSPRDEAQQSTSSDDDRLVVLLAALDHAHNSQPVGSLRRDELYDREILR